MVSQLRALIVDPDRKTASWAVSMKVDSDIDRINQAILEEFDRLVFPHELRDRIRIKDVDDRSTSIGLTDPHAVQFTERFPTVVDGIAVQVEELKYDANAGAWGELDDGSYGDLPRQDTRQMTITAYRTR